MAKDKDIPRAIRRRAKQIGKRERGINRNEARKKRVRDDIIANPPKTHWGKPVKKDKSCAVTALSIGVGIAAVVAAVRGWA